MAGNRQNLDAVGTKLPLLATIIAGKHKEGIYDQR